MRCIMRNFTDEPMDRPLHSTSLVGIALSLTILLIVGCSRSSDMAQPSGDKPEAVAIPHRFQAPEDVRPMAQLAAHLQISDAHENIITNPHTPPKRLPPVMGEKTPADPTPLETIRFPLKIEKSTPSEQSLQLEPPAPSAPPKMAAPQSLKTTPEITPAPVQKQVARSRKPSETETPLALNAPKIELPSEPPKRQPVAPQREIPPSQVVPNFLSGNPQPKQPSPPAVELPREPAGPPSKFVSLAPAQPALEGTLNPAKQEIVNLPGPPMNVGPTMPRMVPMTPAFVPSTPQSATVDHAMIAVRERMATLVDHGLVLAQRGAYYSARAEFIQALRLATQTLDTAEKSHRHSDALAEAIAALEEAGEFIPSGARLEANVDLNLVVDAHRTTVLKGKNLEYETALTAAQAYFSHAQTKLTEACGGMPETGRALVGLGRIQEYLYNTTGDNRTLIGPRSIALFQTALAIDEKNYEAANELGVLLARYGQLEDAKQALLQGVKASPRPELWQNLASVHEKLGETEMARRASVEAHAAREFAQLNGGLEAVRWVSPEQMAEHGKGDTGLKQAARSTASQPIANRTRTSTR